MAKAAKTAIKKDPKQALEAKNYTKLSKLFVALRAVHIPLRKVWCIKTRSKNFWLTPNNQAPLSLSITIL